MTEETTTQMSVNYPGSTIEFFHLSSFYYGCALLDENTVASEPVDCTITITGFDVNGNSIAGPQAFEFDAVGTREQMQLANVESSFQQNKVYKIVFEVSGGLLGLTPTTAALVDTS